MDRLLVNPLSLQTYRVPAQVTLGAGTMRLVDLEGQVEAVDPAEARRYELDAPGAAPVLEAWLHSTRGRRELAQALGGPLAPLLTAQDPEAFVAALSDLTGETDPERLEAALADLEARVREAQDRLAAGQGPELIRPEDAETAPGGPPSPALLALLALVRARQDSPPLEAANEPLPAPLAVAPPAMPDLDFSIEAVRARMERRRNGGGR